ncbi:MAG: NDP-sugar synthase [Candidatus Eremiobacteraeota bacterium]|nr:NDP-sugar synthase [Candidatus Eremiobacteraeota bacterium]
MSEGSKALILSAGLGTRLRPLTAILPKPLMPVANVPLIDIIVERLAGCGFTALGVNLHHMAEEIRRHLESRKGALSFWFSHEEVILGTGGGIAGFAPFLEGEEWFLVHNGDVMGDADIQGLVAFHRERRALATLLLVENEATNVVRVVPSGDIIDIRGCLRPHDHAGRLLTFSGIAVYSGSILKALPRGAFYSIIDFLLEKMQSEGARVAGYAPAAPCYWRDIGSIPSYLALHRDILSRGIFNPPSMGEPHKGMLVGKGAHVAPGARIEGFLSLGEGASIGSGALLRDVVVFPGTAVPEGTEAHDAVFAGSYVAREQ